MAAAITTTTTIGNPVNFIFQERFLRVANLLATYLMGTVAGELIQHGGSFTAKWRRYEQLPPSTSSLSEKTGAPSYPLRTPVTSSVTDPTKAVSKYGQFYLLNEEVELVEPSAQSNELADRLGEAAGRSINRLMRNELEDNSTQVRAGGKTADSAIVSKVTRNGLRAVVRALANNSGRMFQPMTLGDNAFNTSPILAAFWLFCHEDVRPDIEDLAGFVSVAAYGGQTETANGEFGSAGRVRCIATEEASVGANNGGAVGSTGLRTTGGASIDLYDTIVIGQDAVGSLGFGNTPTNSQFMADNKLTQVEFINHARGSAGVADPLAELRSIGYKFWFAAKTLNGNWSRRFTSGATNLQ